jgi:hypothetical protein
MEISYNSGFFTDLNKNLNSLLYKRLESCQHLNCKTSKPERPRNFWSTVVDSLRDLAKGFIKNNPVSWLIDCIQDFRSQTEIQNAKTRNNAKNDLDIKKYHESICYSKDKQDGIFQSSASTKKGAKTQVILFMGNAQSHSSNENHAGLLKLYKELKAQDNCDVMIVRVGDAQTELMHRYGLSSKANLRTDIVKDHISNLIEDRMHSKGMFKDMEKPSNVVTVGFSWGAGMQKEMLDKWDQIGNGVKVDLSVSLDGIKYGLKELGDELDQRPLNTQKHLCIFQNGDTFLNGHRHCREQACDEIIDVVDINPAADSHEHVDNCDEILTKVKENLDEHIRHEKTLVLGQG